MLLDSVVPPVLDVKTMDDGQADAGETFARLKKAVLSSESVHRKGSWPSEVVDPETTVERDAVPAI